jgi:hypothetical protein
LGIPTGFRQRGAATLLACQKSSLITDHAETTRIFTRLAAGNFAATGTFGWGAFIHIKRTRAAVVLVAPR